MGLGAAHTVPSLLTTVCAAQSHQHSRPSPGGTSSPPPGAACLLGSVRRDAVLGGAPLISRGTFLASVWTHHPRFGVWLPLGMNKVRLAGWQFSEPAGVQRHRSRGAWPRICTSRPVGARLPAAPWGSGCGALAIQSGDPAWKLQDFPEPRKYLSSDP